MPKKQKVKSRPQASVKSTSSIQNAILGSEHEDPTTRNARAKALIMSTLVEGSEPWMIAESFEQPSDIWKALEARYAPDASAGDHPDIDVASLKKPNQNVDSGTFIEDEVIRVSDRATAESLGEGSILRSEAQARATKELHESMPNLEQRLLWALLHGGKPETEAWFNGTSV